MRHDGPNGLSMRQPICRWLKVHSYAAPTIIMLIVVVSLIVLDLLCERFSLIADIIAGAVIAVWVTVMLEMYSLPDLELMVGCSESSDHRMFVYVKVENKDPVRVTWFPRKAAVGCIGRAEFFTADGKKRVFCGPPMEVRWKSTREPIWKTPSPTDPSRTVQRFDQDLIVRAVDIYAGNRNARELDIAFRTDGDSVCYPFNNENYEDAIRTQSFKHPKRKLVPGTYLVRVDVQSANGHCRRAFYLHNKDKFGLSVAESL